METGASQVPGKLGAYGLLDSKAKEPAAPIITLTEALYTKEVTYSNEVIGNHGTDIFLADNKYNELWSEIY